MAFTRTGTPTHGGLNDVTANQHHAGAHTPESHTDQGATAAELETLTDGSDSDALHTHPIHPTEAVQADIEAETAGVLFAPLDLLKHHPGIAKVWVKWEQSGAHSILASYNMTSVTDGSNVGDTDHVFNVDFSGVEYVCAVMQDNLGGGISIDAATPAAGTLSTFTSDGANPVAQRDSSHNMMAIFGDQ